jgi:hypothetical protein
MDSIEAFKPVAMLDLNCRVSCTILIAVFYDFDQINSPEEVFVFSLNHQHRFYDKFWIVGNKFPHIYWLIPQSND